MKDGLKQRLDAASYARYERAEAAHYNSMESFPLFTAAAIAANMARLDNEELNTFVAGVGLLRSLYIVTYIMTARQKYTVIRSAIWFASLSFMVRTLLKAGRTLM